MEELGKSTEGRPFIAATIASPETLQHLDRYQEIQRRLADPRLTQEDDAGKLATEGKTVVLITCSIHATELASTQSAVEFAYRLLTDDTPRIHAILQNTIFLLVPSLNPDGVDIVTRWYRRTLGTPFEGTSPPELYQKYVGHDNNRDWYMFTQKETQLTIAKLHNVWHPQIVYDVHQMGSNAARIFVPPWLDPIEPNIDAIVMQESNMIGTAMAADLTAAGQKGVAIHAMYDFWTPSRHYQAFHGGMRILTESASAKLASPITVEPGQLERDALGYNARERSWNFLEPWPGGVWRLARHRGRPVDRHGVVPLPGGVASRRTAAEFLPDRAAAGGAEIAMGIRDSGGAARSGGHAQAAGDAGIRAGGDRARYGRQPCDSHGATL